LSDAAINLNGAILVSDGGLNLTSNFGMTFDSIKVSRIP
jgi:hypothetical protein